MQCKHSLHEFFGGTSRIGDCKHLSLSPTASGCEQNLSSFGYYHSYSRNRLTTKHASSLVWVYCNLRLAQRMQALEQMSQVVEWEVYSEDEPQGTDAEGDNSTSSSSCGED